MMIMNVNDTFSLCPASSEQGEKMHFLYAKGLHFSVVFFCTKEGEMWFVAPLTGQTRKEWGGSKILAAFVFGTDIHSDFQRDCGAQNKLLT